MSFVNPRTVADFLWQVARMVKISQLTGFFFTVDPTVHTGAFMTGFDCHLDHPQQYKIMLLPHKNGQLFCLVMY